ncbi:MAG: SIMPL domain-containing protein [Actinobacteria bacterium]|nr:SIMPL domain-containing protein [Actinomycetota bacterium]MCA1720422.1 SIMPL domain-containing protein [Actinomycetota bacterium]
MKLRRALSAAALSASLAVAYTVGAAGGTPFAAADSAADQPDGITVAGVGTVSGTPDVLRMSLRVVVLRPDVSTALRDANVVTNRIRTSLANHGVKPEDLQTTQLSVNPSYTGRPPHLAGYQVVQGLAAQLRDLTTAGQTVTDAITAGTTYLRFEGVNFVLSDDSPLRVKAREKAFALARSKAEQYAQLAGRTLGTVQSISEDVQPAYYDGSYNSGFASAAPAAGGLAFDPGSQRVDVRVVARWSFV